MTNKPTNREEIDSRLAWTRRPVRNIHITVREPDMEGFDPGRFVTTLLDLKCNFVSILTGGYHSLYRSKIPLNRVNPYLGPGDPLFDYLWEPTADLEGQGQSFPRPTCHVLPSSLVG